MYKPQFLTRLVKAVGFNPKYMASTDIKVIIKTLSCNLVIIKLLLERHTCSFSRHEVHASILIWTKIFNLGGGLFCVQ